jgi:hemolysin activation/secretion protein
VLAAADSLSAQNTRGSFDKWNLDVARMQATSVSGVSLFGRLSAQRAGKNLDSSEGYSLGGAQGVRAYSQGEGTGDEGYFVQLEARYQMGSLAPYVFHDAGRVRVNANNPQPSAANSRSLAGSGLGVRYSEGPLSVEAALAWRTKGGRPADLHERDEKPRAWVVGRYAF